MLGALVIVLREVVEAGLIVGIVLAATHGIPGRSRWITIGVVGGLAGATVIALFAGAISHAFEGSGQELLNAAVLILAVVMLTWHNVWMARHGRELAGQMRQVGSDVQTGARPLTAIAIVVCVAVLREGSEVVLFLYGVAASGTTGAALFVGGLLGLVGGAAVSALSYYGLLAIPLRHLFAVTGTLITLLAAGMAAQAVRFLDMAGYLTAFDMRLWDTSGILSEGSIFGRVLHTLLGYTDHPTGMQVAVYAAALIVMFALTKSVSRRDRQAVAA
jgi:high-affinity iron transporter